MASSISACMPIALRLVDDAIRLDSENCLKEAYCQYLSCCMYISQILKDDAWDKDFHLVYNQDTAKLFMLIRQCQGRALSIVSSQASQSFSPPNSPRLDTRKQLNSAPRIPTNIQPPQQNVQKYSDPIPPRASQDSTPAWRGHARNNSAGSFAPGPPRGKPLQFPSPPSSPPMSNNRRNAVSSSADLNNKNSQPLINAYRARMNQGMAGTVGVMRRGTNRDTITKNLSLMRKMAENQQIARAREEAIKKKIMERQMRLQEEANRRFAFATVISKEEQEQRLLYTRILEFEHEMVWPKQLRDRLKLLPENADLINEIIKRIFSSKDHPLTRFLLQYQFVVYQKLVPLVRDDRFCPEKASIRHEKQDTKEFTGAGENQEKHKEKPGQTEDNNTENHGHEKTEMTEGKVLVDGEPKRGNSEKDDTSNVMSFSMLKQKEMELDDDILVDGEVQDNEKEVMGTNVHQVGNEAKCVAEHGKMDEESSDNAIQTEGTENKRLLAGEEDELERDSKRGVLLDDKGVSSIEDNDTNREEIRDDTTSDSCLGPNSEDDKGLSNGNASHLVSICDDEKSKFGKQRAGISSQKMEDETLDENPETSLREEIDVIDNDGDDVDNDESSNAEMEETNIDLGLDKVISTVDGMSEAFIEPVVTEKTESTQENSKLAENPGTENMEHGVESESKETMDSDNSKGKLPEEDKSMEDTFDLSKLRSLLEEQNSTDVKDSDPGIGSTAENVDKLGIRKSFDLESDFLKLEEEILGWESSEEEEDTDEQIDKGTQEDFSNSLDCSSSNKTLESKTSDESESMSNTDSDSSPKEQVLIETKDISYSEDVSKEPLSPDGDNCGISSGEASSASGVDGGGMETTEQDHERTDKKAGDTTAEVSLEETKSQLRDIFVDIRFFLEKLQKLLILAYEELDTPTGHDQCYASVEHPFFQPLWPLLLAVLRRVNYEKEVTLGCVMTRRIQDSPADMGVTERLCMDDKAALEATGNQFPYQVAVDELHKVVTYVCPLEKLECMVRTSRNICQTVEDYWECKGKPRHCSETSIGCDDLLPILGYVIIKSGMAQLVSECHAMEEFIPEGYLMGEEGYCLTTLQTALAYLATLSNT